MAPTEDDFDELVVTATTVTVTLKGYGGRLIFVRAGYTLSLERPLTDGAWVAGRDRKSSGSPERWQRRQYTINGAF